MKFVSLEKIIKEIERIRIHQFNLHLKEDESAHKALDMVLDTIKTLETIDPYRDIVQHSSVDDGIKAHAKTYSFNIESKLFNQLSEEQQKLWREEIEQAVISGVGVEVDTRYKENLEVKKVNLEEEIASYIQDNTYNGYLRVDIYDAAEHFFELGLKAEGK